MDLWDLMWAIAATRDYLEREAAAYKEATKG